MNQYGGRDEYSVEKRDKNSGKFIEQIDVVETYEEAERLAAEYEDELDDDEIINIYCIEYDSKDEEKAYYLCV